MNEICPDKWEDFVPKKSSCLCSAHSDDSCFEHKPVSLMDEPGEAIKLKNIGTQSVQELILLW